MKQFFLQAKLAQARQCAFCETAKHSNARRFRAFFLAEKVRDIQVESFLARWTAKTRHRRCCDNLRRIDSREKLPQSFWNLTFAQSPCALFPKILRARLCKKVTRRNCATARFRLGTSTRLRRRVLLPRTPCRIALPFVRKPADF